MAPLVEIRDLVYEYPGFRALRDISATIDAGTITALVGPNGAGKTTLLRCLAALDSPYSGEIWLDGLNIHEAPRQSHRMMGYLSDFFGLYDELTVKQCLIYRAAIQRLNPAEQTEAIHWAAAAVKLDDRLNQKAGELSRGLRQRLAIGQAIIHRPKLLLLDEPASGLDPEAREDLASLLTSLRDAGMTIVVSSHILAELEAYSSHMLIIDKGQIVDHAGVGAPSAPGDTVQITVALSEPHPKLQNLLADKVDNLELSEKTARFSLKGGIAAQQELLKALVTHGIPVISFGPERINLQDTYIERVREGRIQ